MSSPWTGEMSTKSGSESQRRVHVCVWVCVRYLSVWLSVAACFADTLPHFHRDYGFDRLLSEVYNSGSDSTTSSYYAVAVVRAESNITYFSQLRGRKSCHTGIGKTSGRK